jgi:hypothetical protein
MYFGLRPTCDGAYCRKTTDSEEKLGACKELTPHAHRAKAALFYGHVLAGGPSNDYPVPSSHVCVFLLYSFSLIKLSNTDLR